MQFTRILALALLLLPRSSAAGVIEVTVYEPLSLAFGPWGASFQGDHFDDIFLDGLPQLGPAPEFSSFEGEVEFGAGPLLSLTLTGDADRTDSHYEFGPGTFTLTAHWIDQFGAPAQGSFVAPLLTLAVDLCEQQLSLNDCGDVFGESLGQFSATFGAGLFDPLLAHALGIARSGELVSPFVFAMDGVSGAPSSDFRIGGSQRGYETLEIFVAVPEPSGLSLLLLSSIAALGSSRMRTRRRQ